MLQKPSILLGKRGQRCGVVPAGVAHFHHSRIFDELAQQALQIIAVERGVFERHGELDQQRAEVSFVGDRVEAFAGAGFVFVGGTDGRGRRGLHHRDGRVREGAVEFRGEEEILVYRRYFAAPQFSPLRL